jgi:hypothetical protein
MRLHEWYGDFTAPSGASGEFLDEIDHLQLRDQPVGRPACRLRELARPAPGGRISG